MLSPPEPPKPPDPPSDPDAPPEPIWPIVLGLSGRPRTSCAGRGSPIVGVIAFQATGAGPQRLRR